MSYRLKHWFEFQASPLIKAILDSNNDLSLDLIAQSADVNARDYKGRTALMCAAYKGNKEIAQILIDAGADVNQRNERKQTALFYSLANNREEVARLLIEKGADVNVSDADGNTPLFYADENLKNGDELLQLLIDEAADLHILNMYGKTLSHFAAGNENDSVARRLIEKGADVNVSDEYGRTPLFNAALHNNKEVTRLLIEKGADVNVSDEDGQTPLLIAARNNNKEFTRLLVEKGADVNVSDKDGRTPLFNAAENHNKEVTRLLIEKAADVNVSDKDGQTPLLIAARNNNQEVARLLIEKGADVNVKCKDGMTALGFALKLNINEVACILLKSNADMNSSDNHGRTPLFHLVNTSDLEYDKDFNEISCREELTRKVAFACSNIDKRDNIGRTALSYAIETMKKYKENERLARIIINAGANVNIKDNKGQTPLFYACMPSAVRLLLDHGGDLTLRNNLKETVLIYSIQNIENHFVVETFGESKYNMSLFEKYLSTLLNSVDANYVNARDMYGRTAMFYAVTKFDYFYEFEQIAKILIDNGALLDAADNNDVSVLTYFIEKYCCNRRFLEEDVMEERFSVFIKNGIPISTVFHSTLNYLYAILPNVLHSYTEVNGRDIFQNALAVAGKFATNNDEQGIDSFSVLFDNDNIPEALDILMMLGANPNSADSYGNTALHYATLLTFHGVSQDCVKTILYTVERHGIRINIKNQEKETPLHYCLSKQAWKLATEKGTWNGIMTVVEICEFLLKDGSLIEETTRCGETVYHLITNLVQKGLSMNDKNIRDTICSNAVEMLNLFSKTTGKRFNVLKKTDDKQNSPLHLWASLSLPANQNYADHITKELNCRMLLETIFKHLWRPGMSPNPMNENDQMPLHLCKTWTAARLLIEAGANPNSLDREGGTPLLNAAKQNVFKINPGHFFPDTEEDTKQFFETCVSLGLDIWCSDKEGQSILSIFLDSEDYKLSKAVIDIVVTSCDSTSIVKQLLDAICKDGSTTTTWKSGLTIELLTSSKLSSKGNLDDALRHICQNIEKTRRQEQVVGIDKGNESDEPPNKRPRIDDSHEEIPSDVFVDIGRQLLFHGADGNSLCNDFPNLHSFLTATISPDQMNKIIPWTSHSKTHEDKLKVVSRKQNVEEIGTYCYHKEPIGHGGFGEVYAGICKNDAREVAIKKINRNQVKGPQAKREIRNLVELSDCQQVVKYISFDVSDNDFVYIVLELMEGHLDHYFASSSFEASRRGGICRDVVHGLEYLHQRKPDPILHRDLKPENILYKFDTHGKLIIKIADFGLSSPPTTGRTTVLHSKAGTRCWMAPEVITSKTYKHSTSSDIFSCGLLLHYILSMKKHPFCPVDCTNKTLREIEIETEYNMRPVNMVMEGFDHALSPEAKHLIKGMLHKDESQRPSAAQSLSQPYFWTDKKKMDFLSAVGNQYEFECPSTNKAARHHVATGVEAHLENNFNNIVRYAKWDDPNYKDMAKVVAEMNKPIAKVNKKGATYFQHPRAYDTGSIIELVRFIRNSTNHVSDRSRPSEIRKLILEDFVFLKEFPHLLIEVYKAVITHGWDNRDEIKYAMTHEEQHH